MASSKAEYAEVAVDALTGPAAGALHYRIPDSLRDRAVAGARVRVPFRRGHSEGYLIGFPAVPAVEELREIAAVIEDVPPIPADLLELGRWIAGRYACALAEAFRVLGPAAARSRPRVKVSLVGEVPPRSGRSGLVLLFLRQGPADLDRLSELVGSRAGALAVVRRLERAGLVTVETDFRPHRRRRRRLLRVVAGEAEEGETPAGRRALAAVRELASPDGPTIAEVTARAAVSATVVARLIREGKIRMEEESGARHRPVPGPAPGFAVTLLCGRERLWAYRAAIAGCLRSGRQALVLVPEIAYATAMATALGGDGDRRVVVLHSELSDGARLEAWRACREADLVVGTRSAVFAPVSHLGLVVVDDEHDEAYKELESPRYHARDVALERARAAGAAVLLGSATPSLESFHRFERLRTAGRAVARASLVDLRSELKAGNRSLFGRELRERAGRVLAAGGKFVLFLNRRGYAGFVLCRECGWVARCPGCELPFSVHMGGRELRCHHCGAGIPAPAGCPRCRSRAVRPFGAGTERVQAEARAAFPGVLVERLDSDVAPDRRRQLEILDRFAREGPAVLVGTQLVLHALDHVALLGVVTADISLHFPDFRAAERTYQLLEALRGRLQAGAHLVVQSYTPDHYALAAVARDEPEHFYREELAVRERMRYPPFGSLGRLLVVGHPGVAEQAARELAARLREPAARHGVTVTGPAPPLVPRVGGRERWQLVLRGREAQQVAEVIRAGLGGVSTRAGLSVSVDVEPLDLT